MTVKVEWRVETSPLTRLQTDLNKYSDEGWNIEHINTFAAYGAQTMKTVVVMRKITPIAGPEAAKVSQPTEKVKETETLE